MDARRFAIMPTGEVLATCAAFKDLQTVVTGWLKRWKHCGSRLDLTAETNASFKDIPFARSYKEGESEVRPVSSMIQLLEDEAKLEGATVDLW